MPLLRWAFLAFFSVSIFFRPTSAWAQDEHYRFEIFVQGGVSVFTSTSSSRTITFGPPTSPSTLTMDTEQTFATTGRLFAGGRYYLTPNNAVEAAYSFSPNRGQLTTRFSVTPPSFFPPPPGLTPPPPLFPPETIFGSFSNNVHNASFNYVRYLPGTSRLKPFATAGVGFMSFSAGVGTSTKFAGNFGGGLDIKLYERVYLRGEFRDFITSQPRALDSSTIHHPTPSVGLAFKL